MFWVTAVRLNVYRYMIGEAHEVSWHTLHTVQFMKCNGDKRLRCQDVFTALRWKEATLVTPGSIWNKNHSKNHAPKHTCLPQVMISWCRAEQLPTSITITGVCYSFLFLFIFYKITLFYLVDFYCFFMFHITFDKIWSWVSGWNSHCGWTKFTYHGVYVIVWAAYCWNAS